MDSRPTHTASGQEAMKIARRLARNTGKAVYIKVLPDLSQYRIEIEEKRKSNAPTMRDPMSKDWR